MSSVNSELRLFYKEGARVTNDRQEQFPDGVRLTDRHPTRDNIFSSLSWSPDGALFAVGLREGSIQVWLSDEPKLKLSFSLRGKASVSSPVNTVAFSPDGSKLASGMRDGRVTVWKLSTQAEAGFFRGHDASVTALAWSPDSSVLVSGAADGSIKLVNQRRASEREALLQPSDPDYQRRRGVRELKWFGEQGISTLAAVMDDGKVNFWDEKSSGVLLASTLLSSLEGRQAGLGDVTCVAWAPHGNFLAMGNQRGDIYIFDLHLSRPAPIRILENNEKHVTEIAFNAAGDLLIAALGSGAIVLWDCKTWQRLASLKAPDTNGDSTYPTHKIERTYPSMAPHPQKDALVLLRSVVLGKRLGMTMDLLELEHKTLRSQASSVETVHYVNAKVLLLGDSGVGKTGLGLTLSGEAFRPTDSTHGRHVWLLEADTVYTENGQETRETFLWDLAGQPGYRLVHQLHLDGVTVALVVFDAKNETDPFTGVRYWMKALRQAFTTQDKGKSDVTAFLVAARTDRGAISASEERIARVVDEHGFTQYFATSAREGWNVDELGQAVRAVIPWSDLPRVSSTALLYDIREFLLQQKEGGRILARLDDLLANFSAQQAIHAPSLRREFATVIGRLESRSLLKQLSFGNLALLQPEYLDAYASAIINAAKTEPDGLGSLVEDEVLKGHFDIAEDERIQDKDEERLLLIATVEELLRRELAVREHTSQGPQLVFPSQLTREWPEAPEPLGRALTFTFDGAILNVYATLVVRLSRSDIFAKSRMWRSAASFRTVAGGLCGLWLRELDEGSGELSLSFSPDVAEETRFYFEEYVQTHLERRTVPGSIRRERVFVCPECSTTVSSEQAKRRKERGHDTIICNVCEEPISLLDRHARLGSVSSKIEEIDRSADQAREEEAASTVLRGKTATNDFDVFMAHNSRDKELIQSIVIQLQRRGLNPWIDKDQIPPGRWFQDVIQDVIPTVKTAAIFLGMHGLGRWQALELKSFISECVEAGKPVIPVLLPGVMSIPRELRFLRELNFVKFSGTDDDEALSRLVWGITQNKPEGLA